jgi:hypothetical protein
MDSEPRTSANRLSTTIKLWEITEKLAPLKLNHTDIVVYLLLRCHARDGRNLAFPSRDYLAKEAHCAPESVSRSTAKLEQLKLIRKDWRRSQAFTVYELADNQATNSPLMDEEQVTDPSPASNGSVTAKCRIRHSEVTNPSTKLLKGTRVIEQKEEQQLARGPVNINSEEQGDDQSARRQRQPACTIEEWTPTERDYQAFLDQGAIDGWLARVGNTRAAADRQFAKFCRWATDNELDDRSPAEWSSTWRSWLTRVARHDERRGRRSGRRSVFDLARGAVARPGAGSPARDG